MKKTILFFFCLCFALMLQAQVSKTVECTAGHLSDSLTSVEKNTVTNLTLTGIIDARDFKTMRDSMPALDIFDLSGTTVVAYTGTMGTASASSTVYVANAIPDRAFMHLIGITSVTMPSSVTYIGIDAFGYCDSITSVTIPSSVTSIGSSAFEYCSGMTSATIPSSVTSIGSTAFMNCIGLTSITIPTSVTFIGDYAFYGCTGLTSITIPSSVTSIGESTFAGCNGLITVEDGNPNYSSIDGVLFNKTQTALLQCPASKTGSYIITSSVTSIGNYAFYNCTGLTTVTIPSSVTSIGGEAFYFCTGLTSITIPSSVTSIGGLAFSNCSGLITVDAGNPNYSSVDSVLFNKTQTQLIQCSISKTGSYTIPSSVTSVCILAFYNCSGLNSITIPSTVTTIATNAFFSCSGLTSIYAFGTTPVDLSASSGVFYNVSKTNCTLYVPAGSMNAYQATGQWNDFIHIIEGSGFWLSVSVINLADTAGSFATVAVNSNTTWTASSDQTWLTISPDIATTGNDTLTFTASANPTLATRIATVTVSATGAGDQTITVNQAAQVGTGVATETKGTLSLYPNPVKSILYLSGVECIRQVDIINIEGRVIANLKNIAAKSINVSNLDNGVYLLHITTESGSMIKKIMKE